MSDRAPRSAGLDDAATGLLAVGCADPFSSSASLRLCCLWAVERLRTVGARPARDLTRISVVDIAATTNTAPVALDGLVDDSAASAMIAEVAAAVRDAVAEAR